MKNSSYIGHLAVFGSNVIYGLNYVVAKGVMPDYFAPRAVIFIRVTGSMLIFWLLDSLINKNQKIEKADVKDLFLYSLFGVALNQIMFFEGLNLTTSINSSIIMTITPILVLVISAIFIREKLTALKIAGVLIGAAGAISLILKGGSLSVNSDHFLGNLFTLINASSFGLYLVLIKKYSAKYHPVTLMKWIFTFGFILILPFCSTKFFTTDFSAVPLRIWLSMAYILVFATILGYLLYNYALTKLTPTATSSYIYLQPIIATLIAFITNTETFGVSEILACLLIFTGVYLTSILKRA